MAVGSQDAQGVMIFIRRVPSEATTNETPMLSVRVSGAAAGRADIAKIGCYEGESLLFGENMAAEDLDAFLRVGWIDGKLEIEFLGRDDLRRANVDLRDEIGDYALRVIERDEEIGALREALAAFDGCVVLTAEEAKGLKNALAKMYRLLTEEGQEGVSVLHHLALLTPKQ